LIAPAMGALADRIGRRRTLSTLRALYTVLAVIIMTLDLSGLMEPIFIFIIAAVAGLIRPSDLVMRNALIGDTMPANKLANAMGLSRTTMDTARMTGALAGAGLLTSLGLGVAYAFVAAMYFTSFILTLRVAHIETDDTLSTRPKPFRQVIDGLAYVRRTPAVLALMWLAFLVNLTGFPLVSNSGLLSYVAREVYGLDATGLSHLAASFGVGSLVASIVMAATGGARKPIHLVFGGAVIWHVLLLLFAFSSIKAEGMALLFFVGVAQGVAMISMAVALLRLAEAKFRGRVMGVRMLAVYGLPIGLALVGPATDLLGFQGAALAAAGTGLVTIFLIAIIWRKALFFDH
jgi:predicted MFS family arabinose efflux permease